MAIDMRSLFHLFSSFRLFIMLRAIDAQATSCKCMFHLHNSFSQYNKIVTAAVSPDALPQQVCTATQIYIKVSYRVFR